MTAPDPSPPTVLTEDERAALLSPDVALAYDNMSSGWAKLTVYAAVERILADRVAAAVRAERERVEVLEAAIQRVRRRHPRGDEESGYLAPGLYCPGCGRERRDNGYGGCDERQALIVPGYSVRNGVRP